MALASYTAMHYPMPNKWLEQLELLSPKELWGHLAPLKRTVRCGAACRVVWGG